MWMSATAHKTAVSVCFWGEGGGAARWGNEQATRCVWGFGWVLWAWRVGTSRKMQQTMRPCWGGMLAVQGMGDVLCVKGVLQIV
jgi:hypothetical protein